MDKHNNLDSGSTCEFGAAGNFSNTDPQLGPLQDNGGPTLTQAPAAFSPAVNGGTNTGCPAQDQRGALRARTMGNACDIGAVEFGSEIPTPTPTATPTETATATPLRVFLPAVLRAAIAGW